MNPAPAADPAPALQGAGRIEPIQQEHQGECSQYLFASSATVAKVDLC